MDGRLKGIPIGVDDFKKLINEERYFVDKSLFIKEIIDDASEVKLITRPRRFGKTLNLSMLKYFFEKSSEDNSSLFQGLKIWKEDERYTREQGKYPVIAITLKDIKFDDYETCYNMLKAIMADEYKRHMYILDCPEIVDPDKAIFKDVINCTADEARFSTSIGFLTRLLHKYHGELVIVLIDEYDTPINNGFIKGYYARIIDFMKVFLGSALKNNIHLKMGVVTGIYRVAKESIFSDLNNLYVSSVISAAYSDKFGFTEDEVEEILKYYGAEYKLDEVKAWYNGYTFGKNTVIYNPWSIVNYVKDKYFQPYWVNTSSNDLIAEILQKTGAKVKQSLELLVDGKAVPNVVIDTNINFRSIINAKYLEERILWNFLIVSGYLKTEKLWFNDNGEFVCDIKIPNREILKLYRDIISNWFNMDDVSSDTIRTMLKCLISGKMNEFEEDFKYLVQKTFSSFDVGRNAAENFYHAFVLGLLVNLDGKYRVLSNREAGNGRPDVIIIPEDKSKKGIIMEFKVSRKSDDESMQNAVQEVLLQIDEKHYADELKSNSIKHAIKVGIAFFGKEVYIGYEHTTL